MGGVQRRIVWSFFEGVRVVGPVRGLCEAEQGYGGLSKGVRGCARVRENAPHLCDSWWQPAARDQGS